MEGRRPKVVYDANVLLPFHTAHLLAFVAAPPSVLVDARWTAKIQSEWVERSLEKFPALTRSSIEARRDAMNRAMPGAMVVGYEGLIDTIEFPDPDDRHVVAAALHCGAKTIVTRDRKHFTEAALAPYGLKRADPDDLLVELYDAEPELTLDAIEAARLVLRKSMPDWGTYLDILDTEGFTELVRRIRDHHPQP